tara:strand:- start:51 stop:1832 length:1782 start_codon:yes stop_codon:yes gene_type:complete
VAKGRLTNQIENKTIDNPKLLRGRHECHECGSSDSFGWYEDHATCFGACNKTWFYIGSNGTQVAKQEEDLDFDEIIETLEAIQTLPIRGVQARELTRAAMEFYGVRTELKEDGSNGSRYYPWTADGKLTTYKQKHDDVGEGKKFYLKGDTRILNRPKVQLFGQHLFPAGGKTLIITEGEDDTIAIQRAYMDKYSGRQFPVVSVFNSNDVATVVKNIEWVNSFEKVILWGDNDKNDAGEKLMSQIAKIVGPGKAHIIEDVQHKDANDALIAIGGQGIINKIWGAVPYSPAGFVFGEALWDRFKDRENVAVIPYPECLSGLNMKLKGMRKGEIVLFVSGTGSGKTTVTKEVMLKIINDPTETLGIISLEEDVGESVQKLLEMYLGLDIMDDDNPVPEAEKRRAFDALFSDGRIIVLDHQGSVSDESLIDKMRALCAMGMTNLVLDHITIAVSEGNEGLTGNEAIDKMMSDLLKLVKGWPVWLGVISHLRKTGSGSKSFEEGHMPSMDDIKGSGSIKQVSFDIIAFSRNMTAENEIERNTIEIMVLKARFTGKTGSAGRAYYDGDTRRLKKVANNSTEAAEDLFEDVTKNPSKIGL